MIETLHPFSLSPLPATAGGPGPTPSSSGPTSAAPTGEAPNFEALLMSMLVKELRQGMVSELFPGDDSDIMGSLFDLHMGEHLSDFAQLGMNESLLRQNSAAQSSLRGPSRSETEQPSSVSDATADVQ